ncbi:MAG: SDR family NAD(P)-dependent oxidoreductase [Myxococcales bacterium]|nr:SDR family NAD(P)-dependent oxidoreductase [Myxococcales bacterium]
MNDQATKLCAIVGVGPGLGLAIARRFAREGFHLALVARDPDKLRDNASALASQTAVEIYPTDAADGDALAATFAAVRERQGAPDVLVYNAAVLDRGKPSELTADGLVRDFRVNVVGATLAAQAVLPAMRERGEGTILFTGGGLALQPYPDFASLAIGKAGIRSLTFSLAQEVADDGIHVGTVTICGFIRAGTKFDPDTIAESYWELHSEDRRSWSHERTIR